jgi:hypothetical protein
MADKLPFGGSPNNTPNKPRRMLYQQSSWTLPASNGKMTDLEYDLRVGKITEAEYKARVLECAARKPAKQVAMLSRAETR